MKITRQGAYGDQHEHVYLGLLWFSLKCQDKVPIVTLNEVEKVNLQTCKKIIFVREPNSGLKMSGQFIWKKTPN